MGGPFEISSDRTKAEEANGNLFRPWPLLRRPSTPQEALGPIAASTQWQSGILVAELGCLSLRCDPAVIKRVQTSHRVATFSRHEWPRVGKRGQTDAGPAASWVLEEESRGNNHNAQPHERCVSILLAHELSHSGRRERRLDRGISPNVVKGSG
jgi:hypothetical protein